MLTSNSDSVWLHKDKIKKDKEKNKQRLLIVEHAYKMYKLTINCLSKNFNLASGQCCKSPEQTIELLRK